MEKNTYLNNKLLFACNWKVRFKTFSTDLTRFFTRPFSFCLLVSFSSGAVFGQSPLGKPGTAGDFEIDGNYRVDNSPLKDWRSVLKPDPQHPGLALFGVSTVAGENAKWIVDGNSGTANNEKEVFRGTSNKNGDFIGAGQSPYAIETSSPSAPQKNDITNVYARATTFPAVGGHRWIMLAAETRSVDGTSYLDFEYNQAGVHKDATGMLLIGDGPNGGRTAKTATSSGDLLFVVDFAKGGNAPVPRIFEWRPTGKAKPAFDWFEFTPLPANVFIVTNGADVETAGFNSGFTGGGAPSSTTLALQLVEIGVDLDALGLSFDNPCNPAATLNCKTRTSSSYTSELKDFSLFQFSLVPPATLTKPDNQKVCPGDNASFSSTADGAGATGSGIQWYKVSGQIETLIVDDNTKYDIDVSGLTSTLTVHNVAAADAGTYRVKLTGATCGASPQEAALTVNPVPVASAGNAPDPQCFNLNGNTFSLSGSGSNGTPSWAVAPNGNPGSFTVDITGGDTYTPSVKVTSGASGGSVTLRLTVTSDQTPPCGNKTSDVTVTILPQAAGPQVTYIPPQCLEATFKVTVDNPVSGSTYTLRQLTGGVSLLTKKAPDDVVGGKITFEGLTPGKGYRITETNSAGCISAPNTCGDFSGVTGATVNAGKQPTITEQEITLNGAPKTNVLAAPNPFNDRIRFTLKSSVSGQGSLELFNMLGQKVKTVFRGYVNANESQTIEYAVPYSQRSSMIYLFRVGTEHTSGKLIGLR